MKQLWLSFDIPVSRLFYIKKAFAAFRLIFLRYALDKINNLFNQQKLDL
jgi:hypothetical protein